MTMMVTTTARRFATGVTTLIIPILALLMAITDRSGSRAAYLSVRAPGTVTVDGVGAVVATGTVIAAIAVASETMGIVAVTDIAAMAAGAFTVAVVGMAAV